MSSGSDNSAGIPAPGETDGSAEPRTQGRAGESEIGLAGDLEAVRRQVVRAWDAFLALTADLDSNAALGTPTRLPGWSVGDVLVHLGSWDDAGPLARVLASARSGEVGPTPRPDEVNAAVVAAHRGAPPAQVRAALVRARDAVAGWLDSPEAADLGRRETASILGPIPVLTAVNGSAWELAVHALDLRAAPLPARRRITSSPAAPALDGLLLDGLAAVVDITGLLAARAGLVTTVTAQSPVGGWRLATSGRGWRAEPVPAGPYDGTGVRGELPDLLEVSAGRAAVPALLASRRLVVQSLPSFLELAPLVQAIPGLPGRLALHAAALGLTGVGKLLRRVPGLR